MQVPQALQTEPFDSELYGDRQASKPATPPPVWTSVRFSLRFTLCTAAYVNVLYHDRYIMYAYVINSLSIPTSSAGAGMLSLWAFGTRSLWEAPRTPWPLTFSRAKVSTSSRLRASWLARRAEWLAVPETEVHSE